MKPSDYIKKGWTQFYMAKDTNNNPVFYKSDEAAQWCTYGALCKVHGSGGFLLARKLNKQLNIESLAIWNDTPGRTKEEVIAALEAIGE
jgi:hypothetical protein